MSDYLTTPAQSVHSKVRKAYLRAQEDKKCPKALLASLQKTLVLAAQWAGKDTSTEVQESTPAVDLAAERAKLLAENAALKASTVTDVKAIPPTVRRHEAR